MFADRPGGRVWALCVWALVALASTAVLATGCQPIPVPDTVSSSIPTPAAKAGLGLTIVHSNDTWGYLTPCG
jgi:hypothetical protein